jgi:hypothetical protein
MSAAYSCSPEMACPSTFKSLTARIGSSGGADREQAARTATRVSTMGKAKDRGMVEHLEKLMTGWLLATNDNRSQATHGTLCVYARRSAALWQHPPNARR